MAATAVAIEPDNTLIEPAPARRCTPAVRKQVPGRISAGLPVPPAPESMSLAETPMWPSTNVASKSANVASRTTNVNVNRAAHVNIRKLCAAGELLVAPGGAVAAGAAIGVVIAATAAAWAGTAPGQDTVGTTLIRVAPKALGVFVHNRIGVRDFAVSCARCTENSLSPFALRHFIAAVCISY